MQNMATDMTVALQVCHKLKDSVRWRGWMNEGKRLFVKYSSSVLKLKSLLWTSLNLLVKRRFEFWTSNRTLFLNSGYRKTIFCRLLCPFCGSVFVNWKRLHDGIYHRNFENFLFFGVTHILQYEKDFWEKSHQSECIPSEFLERNRQNAKIDFSVCGVLLQVSSFQRLITQNNFGLKYCFLYFRWNCSKNYETLYFSNESILIVIVDTYKPFY